MQSHAISDYDIDSESDSRADRNVCADERALASREVGGYTGRPVRHFVEQLYSASKGELRVRRDQQVFSRMLDRGLDYHRGRLRIIYPATVSRV
jgi:hypothetical protein